MKKIFLFLFLFLILFSCKKEVFKTNNTELWLKVGSSIEKLDITFDGIDHKNKHHCFDVKYENGVFDPTIKELNYTLEEGLWTLVHVSQLESDEIIVSYKGENYKTRGFYLGERRFMEIETSSGGEINFNDCDIDMIDRLIFVE